MPQERARKRVTQALAQATVNECHGDMHAAAKQLHCSHRSIAKLLADADGEAEATAIAAERWEDFHVPRVHADRSADAARMDAVIEADPDSERARIGGIVFLRPAKDAVRTVSPGPDELRAREEATAQRRRDDADRHWHETANNRRAPSPTREQRDTLARETQQASWPRYTDVEEMERMIPCGDFARYRVVIKTSLPLTRRELESLLRQGAAAIQALAATAIEHRDGVDEGDEEEDPSELM